MSGWADRLGVTPRPEAALAAAAVGVLAGLWSGVAPLGLALGLGGGLLIGQVLHQRRDAGEARDRDQVRRLIETAAPLARAGMSLDAALRRAARAASGPGASVLADGLSAQAVGRSVDMEAFRPYPYTTLLFELLRLHREQGGDPQPFLTAYRTALGMSEDLAKKKQLALTQIRWQANVITVFFFLVLGFSAAHAGVFVSALLESPDGRWMTTLAATLVIWGRVALNGLARTMS